MISKNTCIKLEYDGYVKETGSLFDTTDKAKAKDAGIFNERVEYGPITVIVGQGFVIQGLDEALEGKKVGDSFKVEIPPEKAFGKKNGKLFRLIPTRYFTKNKITPVAGMQVVIDNVPGIVKTVSPGRVIVDFNHPLAGKNLVYDVKIVEEVKKPEEIVKAIVGFFLPKDRFEVEIKDSEILIKTKTELPGNMVGVVYRLVEETLGKKYKVKFERSD